MSWVIGRMERRIGYFRRTIGHLAKFITIGTQFKWENGGTICVALRV